MPITKSAKKALRQSVKKNKQNKIYKYRIKTLFKEIHSLISNKKIKEAEKLLPQIYRALDKAAKANVIRKNTASRKKSRITKLVKSTGSVPKD